MINVTDPDSRNLKTTRGWVQGFNAQAVVGEDMAGMTRVLGPARSSRRGPPGTRRR
jgi:hypothetical protein